MFQKLRDRLILTNLGITTVIIVIAFTAIYVYATNSARNRPPDIAVTVGEERLEVGSEDLERAVNSVMERERAAAAQDLLVMLVAAGIAIEIAVALISYLLAEEAIKPVRETYEAQKVFIANASHEIKTPLAAIAANLEAADIKGNKWIANAEKETAKLAELNGELLNLAKTDLTKQVVKKEISLNKLVAETLESFQPRLKEIELEKTLAGSGKVKLNAEDLEQILRILLDNAIKYSDKKITLRVDNRGLTVANDGKQINAEDLPHIFERFYQADKSAEGVGLGLSIAKALAERNGWMLRAKSDQKSTDFIVKF